MQQFFGQSQNQQQNQRQPMPEPPNFISTKDLAYLKDAMSWELIAFKKCNHFAQECTSEPIRNALDSAGQMHLRHYQQLLSQVDPQKAMAGSNLNPTLQ
ncbi:MAG: hypothetical protein ACOWWO_19330 [Peptococcaceae bacterium]